MSRVRQQPDGRARALFAPEELRLRPTGTTRLREMARVGRAWLTAREVRAEETRRMMDRLRVQAVELCRRHGLRFRLLQPERDGVNEHYGICYEDGEIRIRLRHARTGRLLKESSLVDTLCHELAHLRHLNHGKAFRKLYQKILEDARALGYYRPGPGDTPRRPRQAALFDGLACGTGRERQGRERG